MRFDITDSKTCGTCRKSLPLTGFSIKNQVTGLRQSRCRACVREYSRAHHAANRATINPQIRQRTVAQRAKLARMEAEALATAACSACGGTQATGADLILRPPAELTGGRPVSRIVGSGGSAEKFAAMIAVALAQPGGVLCRVCLGRVCGSRAR